MFPLCTSDIQANKHRPGLPRVLALARTLKRLQRLKWLPALSFSLQRRRCEEKVGHSQCKHLAIGFVQWVVVSFSSRACFGCLPILIHIPSQVYDIRPGARHGPGSGHGIPKGSLLSEGERGSTPCRRPRGGNLRRCVLRYVFARDVQKQRFYSVSCAWMGPDSILATSKNRGFYLVYGKRRI